MTDEKTNLANAVENTLNAAKEQDYAAVLVIGMKEDRSLGVSASSDHIGNMHWLLSRAAFEVNIADHSSIKTSSE